MKKGRFKNNDETTASLAWSTCSSAGVSPKIENHKSILDFNNQYWRIFWSLQYIIYVIKTKQPSNIDC